MSFAPYDADGRPTTMTVGNVQTAYGFDNDSRLTSQTYTWTPTQTSLGNLVYGYDQDNRLTSETGSLAATTLPASEGVSNPNTYYNTNQLQTWNGHTPATPPDAANNLTADPNTGAGFSWDARNQLSSISGGPAGSFSAEYDATERRYNQTTAFGGTTTYLDDDFHVVQLATPVLGNSASYMTMPGSGEVLTYSNTTGQPPTTTTYVPIHDRLGSTVGLVNSSGTLATQYTYDPYGNVTTSGQASSYSFLFAGMELDATGLYHLQSRYYHPGLARFLSEDPLMSGQNLFEYAADSPTNFVDPLGQDPQSTDCGEACAQLAQGFAQGGQDFGNLIGQAILDLFQDPFNLLNDLFGGLFGGGQSAPVLPPRYHRSNHPISGDMIGTDLAIAQNPFLGLEIPRVLWVPLLRILWKGSRGTLGAVLGVSLPSGRQQAIGKAAGAFLGAYGVGEAGFYLGLEYGALLGAPAGPLGSGPGAVVGGVIGSYVGSIAGGTIGGAVGKHLDPCGGKLNCGEPGQKSTNGLPG